MPRDASHFSSFYGYRIYSQHVLTFVFALIKCLQNSCVFVHPADFDSISDPIMKAKMVALKGINKMMSQGNLGLNPMVVNRYNSLILRELYRMFIQPWGFVLHYLLFNYRFQQTPAAPSPEGTPQPPQLVGQVCSNSQAFIQKIICPLKTISQLNSVIFFS